MQMMGNKRDGRAGIQVSPEAHAAFQKVCESRAVGRSMFDAASRLIEWFVRQSQPVQTAVLSDVDAGMEHYYAAALEQLAEDERQRASGITKREDGTEIEGLVIAPHNRPQGSRKPPRPPRREQR
jgi:hypothetical protein